MVKERRKTKQIHIGSVTIGGDAPIVIQSMTNTKTYDVAATLAQIQKLAEAGCDVVRIAVPDEESAAAVKDIVKASPVPLIADIHFDYRLALSAVKNGIHGLRINPGNIGGKDKVLAVTKACKERGLPIRIGVNGGSLEKELLAKYGGVTADGLVESALEHIRMLEEADFYDMKISLKCSHIPLMLDAYEKLGRLVDYPFHIGVTEAGTVRQGTVKSAVGIGALLSRGIGDTLRVSLAGDPVEEIFVAKTILQSLDLRQNGVEYIVCPTCGRTEIDLPALAAEVEDKVGRLAITVPLKVAIMGCAVNGPGEAKEADVGIAGGKDGGLLFVKGQIKGKYPTEALANVLIDKIIEVAREKNI